MRALTGKQNGRLSDIIDFVNQEGYFPTQRQLADRWQVSLHAVQQTLEALERKSYITAPRLNKSESGRINYRADGTPFSNGTPMAPQVVSLPIAGMTTAGRPMLAEDRIEGHLILSADLKRGLDTCFVLRVRGDSMVGLHILDRDLAIVKKQNTALDGDIVVARIDDEATIKTFRRKKKKIRLEPANPQFEPIEINPSDCVIEGKVVGLLRLT